MLYRLLALFAILIPLSTQQIHAQSKVVCPSCHGSRSSIENCTYCHNGAIFCTNCNGRGSKTSRCSACNGSGVSTRQEKTVCSNCGGRKYFSENRPTSCTCRGGKRPMKTRGGNIQYVNCNRCNGSGQLDNYINVACRQCDIPEHIVLALLAQRAVEMATRVFPALNAMVMEAMHVKIVEDTHA